MREILFKAKTTKKDNPINAFNDVWVEGDLVRSCGKYYIHPMSNKVKIDGELGKVIIMHEVEPSTLCQYTGLTDKNGQKIWENDIVELPDENVYFKCEWEKDTARFVLNGDRFTVDFDDYREYEVEVIGNIFDNADLLEVE